jgi:hypothetical protein
MKKISFLFAAILGIACVQTTTPLLALGDTIGVSGAAEGTFPAGTSLSGIALRGLQLGQGMFIAQDGTAKGQFYVLLLGTSPLGQPQNITVEGEVSNGLVNSNGSVSFGGRATVDMGNGTLPLLDVPFSVTAGTSGVQLTLGTITLPSVAMPAGSITIE